MVAEAGNYDWVIWLDPDEYLTDDGWDILLAFLESAPGDAYVPTMQHTYWKSGYEIDPPEDYKQIIATRPSVRFIDKRVVNSNYGFAPVGLHHMSWARTDEEVWRKITHFSHAHEINAKDWYDNIWLKWQPNHTNLHPLTPPSLRRAVPTELPPDLFKLSLW